MKSKVDTNQNGKRVGKASVEVRKQYGEKVFSTRFDCSVYGNEAENVGSLQPGTLVYATGEAGAYVDEYKGKQYARMTITGRVCAIDTGNFEQHRQSFERGEQQPSLPTQQRASALSPAQQAAQQPEEDDVPF